MRKIKYKFRSLTRSIKNLIYWFPIVWKDRDWDHFYLSEFMYHKMSRMYDRFSSDKSVTNWDIPDQDKALQALRICIEILKRRQNYFYSGVLPDFCSMEEVRAIMSCEQRDLEILGKLISKYLPYWWD